MIPEGSGKQHRSPEHEANSRIQPEIVGGTGGVDISSGKKVGLFHINGSWHEVDPEHKNGYDRIEETDRTRIVTNDSTEAHHHVYTRITLPRNQDEVLVSHSHHEAHDDVTYFNREHGMTYQPSLETAIAQVSGLLNGANTGYCMVPRFESSKGYALEVNSDYPVRASFREDETVLECFGSPDEITISDTEGFYAPRRSGEFVQMPEGTNEGVGVVLRGSPDEVMQHVDNLLSAGCALQYVQLENVFGRKSSPMLVSDRAFWGNTIPAEGYPELISKLTEQGIEVIGYLNTYIESEANLYDQFRENGWLVEHDGSVFETTLVGNNTVCVVDLFNADAREALMQHYADAFAGLGINSFKLDFGEGHPDQTKHQKYSAEVIRFGQDLRDRIAEQTGDTGFFYSRTATLKNHPRYGKDRPFMLWSGDYTANFRNDSFTAAINRSVDNQTAGFPSYFEIGGFYNFAWLYNNPVFMRASIEAGMLNMFVRSHVGADHRWPLNSHVYSENLIDFFSAWSRIRFGVLKPFFDEQIEHWNSTGQPIWKRFYPFHYQDGAVSEHRTRNQFYVGSNNDLLLAIPSRDVPLTRTYSVCVPRDSEFINLKTGEHVETNGSVVWQKSPVRSGCAIFYRGDSKHAPAFAEAQQELRDIYSGRNTKVTNLEP